MARSQYIYYFQNVWTGQIIAMFTVKGEALYFAKREGLHPLEEALWRVKDGERADPKLLQYPPQD